MTGTHFRELKPGSFVYALDHALDTETCRKMIDQFEAKPDQHYVGKVGQQAQQASEIKRSTDLRISGRADWKEIDQILQSSLSHALGLLSALHPFFRVNRLNDIGYNLQRTQSGEFYHWHTDSGPGDFTKRQLVAIWYLDDWDGRGGETEFYFQGLTVKPEAGMLILFPPFWTHIHRGVTMEQDNKYIATTWVCIQ